MSLRLWAPPTAMAVLLFVIAQYSFLSFHTFAELFAIVISFVMFAVAWSTYDFSRNHFLHFLACGYLWIGSLDLMHTLTYKGMDVFVEGSGNLAVQFWIGTRYSEALLLLAAPFAATRMQNKYLLVTVFGIVAVGITVSVLSGIFPVGFVEGKGLTDFKIYSEYLIDFILALALVALFQYGRSISTEEKVLVAVAIVMTMFAELAFTFYVSVYGLSNLMGHIFKLYSFWFIFHAVVIYNLKKPYTALQESEERYAFAVTGSQSGIWEWNIETGEQYFSPRWHELFGYQEGDLEFVHKTFENMLHPDDKNEVLRAIKAHFEDHVPYDEEYRFRRKDGGYTWVQVKGQAAWDEDGKPVRMAGSTNVIDERKLLEVQLRQSQKMEAVGQLTGGVAHDFNNLLSVMIGNTEQLEDKVGDDEDVQRHIGALKRAIDRASSLTSRLLAFSRQQTLSPKSTALNGLVLGLEDMLQRTLGETIDLSVDTSKNLRPAMIDPQQLDSALVNLAINARDAMPDGGSLTIETSNATLDEAYASQYEDVEAGDYIRIDICDTGTGMSPEVKDNVFEPFFTTKEFGKGSGLGLSIVYGFVKQSKGHISIDSQEDKGTTVSLYLPVANEETEETDEDKSSINSISRHKTILLVEDDPDVRETAASLMDDIGYEVIEAEDGQQALDILEARSGEIDLVFTDVIMPHNMSGIELAERITKIGKDIKILLTSGYPDKIADQDHINEMGIKLLAKPYFRDQLIAAIEGTFNS